VRTRAEVHCHPVITRHVCVHHPAPFPFIHHPPPHTNSASATYQSQARLLFAGAGVVSAATDATASSGVLIAVGSRMFRVDPTGAITLMGPIQDAALASPTSVVPMAMALLGVSRQCSGSSATGTQGALQTQGPGVPSLSVCQCV
jgi:hypothetical protein